MKKGKFVVWDGNHRVKALLQLLNSGNLTAEQAFDATYYYAEILHPDTPIDAIYKIIGSRFCI